MAHLQNSITWKDPTDGKEKARRKRKNVYHYFVKDMRQFRCFWATYSSILLSLQCWLWLQFRYAPFLVNKRRTKSSWLSFDTKRKLKDGWVKNVIDYCQVKPTDNETLAIFEFYKQERQVFMFLYSAMQCCRNYIYILSFQCQFLCNPKWYTSQRKQTYQLVWRENTKILFKEYHGIGKIKDKKHTGGFF